LMVAAGPATSEASLGVGLVSSSPPHVADAIVRAAASRSWAVRLGYVRMGLTLVEISL
jgi:hypothetical protein